MPNNEADLTFEILKSSFWVNSIQKHVRLSHQQSDPHSFKLGSKLNRGEPKPKSLFVKQKFYTLEVKQLNFSLLDIPSNIFNLNYSIKTCFNKKSAWSKT